MKDSDVLDELDRALAAQHFGPVDASDAIRRGARIRRARRAKVTAWSMSACVLAAVVVATQTGTSPAQPSPAFGDPGSRMSLVGDGGRDQGYPDLVVQRTGDDWVTISGFGWPIAGMEKVSDSTGTVAFPEVSKLDAESMCLPMLIQAAPEVPNDAWQHSGAWIDGFPTRNGLLTSYEAEHEGKTYSASCTIPGDYNPPTRPDLSRVPAAGATAGIVEQCSYQGHVDFRQWTVAATSRVGDTLSAALLSQDDHLARCVLSADPAQRITQVSRATVAAADANQFVLYGGSGTDTLTIIGSVPPSVTDVQVTAADLTTTVTVHDQTYALTMAVPGGVDDAPLEVRGVDETGSEVFSQDGSTHRLLPTLCFNTVETDDDGC